jgi:hypothetical protein
MAAKDVQAAARQAGIALPTLNRAKRALAVRSERSSDPAGPRGAGHWFWSLPGAHPLADQHDRQSLERKLDHVDHLERSTPVAPVNGRLNTTHAHQGDQRDQLLTLREPDCLNAAAHHNGL